MIKGAQRRVIVVKMADSRVFEEAYFVMRGEQTACGGDMVAEANRIIEENLPVAQKKRKISPRRLLFAAACFMGGTATGAVAVLLAVL